MPDYQQPEARGRPHHVVVVGGGFGGLYAAQSLRHAPVRLTLVDRRNFHLFQPLLYQVATGGLSPANIAAPFRAILKRQRNALVLLGDVTGIDPSSRLVFMRDPLDGCSELAPLHYDTLIVATGSRPSYFNHEHWAALAPGLKTIEDATEIRGRILAAFEAAERNPDGAETAARLSFVIVGGGPTGVELAGAIAEIARDTLRHDFRLINPADARIVILEAAPRILMAYPPVLSQKAADALARLGVEVRCNSMVTDIKPDAVAVKRTGSDNPTDVEWIPTHTVLWAAGVAASGLGRILASATGAEVDRGGRVVVAPDFSLPNHPEMLVIGDLANYSHAPRAAPAAASDVAPKPLPGIAPVAIQEGRFVANLITARLLGRPLPEFRYKDKGDLATIGRAHAVADFRWLRISGFVAWVAWLFVHLMYLVQFQNRLLVLLQWAGNYFTRNRSARLITRSEPPKNPPRPGA